MCYKFTVFNLDKKKHIPFFRFTCNGEKPASLKLTEVRVGDLSYKYFRVDEDQWCK